MNWIKFIFIALKLKRGLIKLLEFLKGDFYVSRSAEILFGTTSQLNGSQYDFCDFKITFRKLFDDVEVIQVC